MEFPENLKYTPTHEWLKVEGDKGSCGITDFAQSELSDVVFVEFKPVGTKVEKGKSVGTIEAVKAVSDIFAPVSGEIIEVNTKVTTSPDLINKSPYNDGWLVKIKIANSNEVATLLSKSDYEKLAHH
ncbi:MAG: glycine cleavage system protein GcvH [bacterium]|nr:glycine cleavage system protein GcvH [bacterium]